MYSFIHPVIYFYVYTSLQRENEDLKISNVCVLVYLFTQRRVNHGNVTRQKGLSEGQ